MKDWQDFPDDDELERADDLLGQADALLRRHRGDTAPSSPGTQRSTDRDAAEPVHATPSGAAMQAFDDVDLPILTEVVEGVDLPAEIFLPVEPSAFVTHPPATPSPAFIRTPLQPTPPTEAVLPAATEPGPTSQPPSSAAAEQQLAERLVELDTAIAREIDEWRAVDTFLRAARRAEASPEPLSLLRERVTSKGGTTPATLQSFDEAGLRAIIARGVQAATARGRELGDLKGKD